MWKQSVKSQVIRYYDRVVIYNRNPCVNSTWIIPWGPALIVTGPAVWVPLCRISRERWKAWPLGLLRRVPALDCNAQREEVSWGGSGSLCFILVLFFWNNVDYLPHLLPFLSSVIIILHQVQPSQLLFSLSLALPRLQSVFHSAPKWSSQ